MYIINNINNSSKYCYDKEKFKLLMRNIRNLEILTSEDFEFINNLPKEQLLEIINVYNLHVKAIKPILNEL
jgi:hypothetical protein